jgi:hypothetical protein
MVLCQSCGKELQQEWNTCPFCSYIETEIKVKTIKKINLSERLFNYFLGFISIGIGLTLDSLLDLAYPGVSVNTFGSICFGLQLLLVGLGAYMIIQTAENSRQFKNHNP